MSMMLGGMPIAGRDVVLRAMCGAVEDAAAWTAQRYEQSQRNQGGHPEGFPPPLSRYRLALASQ